MDSIAVIGPSQLFYRYPPHCPFLWYKNFKQLLRCLRDSDAIIDLCRDETPFHAMGMAGVLPV